jgi:fructose/tagatose bisphosphate aldolase
MALVSMRELLDHAAEHGYGIPAFNVNNLEQVQAVMEAAKEVGAPSSCRPVPARASTRANRSSSTWCRRRAKPTRRSRW